nr:FAD-dependent oxidoreductase [Novosphingobium hassiacum]
MAGGGHAHLAVLADWARQPLADTTRVLVTSSRHSVYSGMVPGWLAGIYDRKQLLIDLAPLAERAGAELVIAEVTGVDPVRQSLQLSTGVEMGFDLLSLAIGGEIESVCFSSLGKDVLPIRPMDEFIHRWQELRQSGLRLHVGGIGGGAAGVELILGVDAALRTAGRRGKVALIAPADGFLAGHATKVRNLALAELARREIEVHFASAEATGDALVLSNGEHLSFDVVIVATGSRAPGWIKASGLACSDDGFVSVGAEMRSVSHPAIFAAGDIIERVDRKLARSGVHAVKAGPVLAANLRAVVCGGKLRQYQPSGRTLYLLATGDRRAILSWGGFATVGRLAWWLKDQIDRRFVRRYS